MVAETLGECGWASFPFDGGDFLSFPSSFGHINNGFGDFL